MDPEKLGAEKERTGRQLGLQARLRPRGRPRKKSDDGAAMPF
jgi:hypothetical protein